MTGIRVALSPDQASVPRRGRLWLLLGAALIAVLAMHALSAHDAAGDHRAVPSAAAMTVAGGQQQAGGDTLSAAVHGQGHSASADSPAGDTHVIVAGCMFLLAAAVVAFLVVLRRESPLRPAAVLIARFGGLRGPPKPSLRLALCVERI
jgi:hypothetical protein